MSFEQRFSEIHPHIYFLLKNEEKFTEAEWQKNLAVEAAIGEETLTPLQKAFFSALRTPDVDAVKLLIQCGNTNPEFKPSWLLTTIDYWKITNPLSPAQPYFSAEMQSLIWNLIVSHNDPHHPEEMLRWAISTHQSKEIIDAYINSIQNLNARDQQGLTFLHLACFFNQEKTVETLLCRQADPHRKDETDNLPLHFACANNHPGIVRRLLTRMTDRSSIRDILRNDATHSSEVQTLLLAFAPPTPAVLLKKNGLHKNKAPIILLPAITIEWNQAVEAAFKRQKMGGSSIY